MSNFLNFLKKHNSTILIITQLTTSIAIIVLVVSIILTLTPAHGYPTPNLTQNLMLLVFRISAIVGFIAASLLYPSQFSKKVQQGVNIIRIAAVVVFAITVGPWIATFFIRVFKLS